MSDEQNPSLPPRPYPNSYWATPLLLGSEYPTANVYEWSVLRIGTLLDLGVVDFVDLTESHEAVPGGIRYVKILEEVAASRGMIVIRMNAPTLQATMTPKPRARSFGVTGSPGRTPSPGRRPVSADSPMDWRTAPPPNTIRYAHIPIRDTTTPSTPILQSVLNVLYFSQTQNRRSILHCNGGYGRTGTIMGCYLVFAGYARDTVEPIPNTFIKQQGAGGQVTLVQAGRPKSAGEAALDMLAKKWKGVDKSWKIPYTPGNAPQMDYVKAFRPPANAQYK